VERKVEYGCAKLGKKKKKKALFTLLRGRLELFKLLKPGGKRKKKTRGGSKKGK